MRLAYLIMVLPLLAGTLADSVEAKSFEQLSYELHIDPYVDVRPDLERLVALGDARAQRLLGDIIAERDPGAALRVIELYRQSFAEGQGQVAALAAMARYIGQRPRLKDGYEVEVAQSLAMFPHERDPITVLTALEVFSIYPDMFDEARIERLITLYKRACIERCVPALYQATLAKKRGNMELAETLYRQAAMQDVRAFLPLHQIFGSNAPDMMRVFAREASSRIDEIPVDVVHRFGLELTNIRNALASEWIFQRQTVIGEVEIPDEEQIAAAEEAQRQQDAMIDEIDGELLVWLDNAVARGFTPAMSTKASFMMAANNRFGSDAVEPLLQLLESTEASRSDLPHGSYLERVLPHRIKALWARFYMTSWLTMNPSSAHQLILELIEDGHDDARLMEGDLYSRGLLDEPDQARALQIYQTMADRSWASAHLRIARLNAYGRAMRGDLVLAYSHAITAMELGDVRAEGLVKFLEQSLSLGQLGSGREMAEYNLRNITR